MSQRKNGPSFGIVSKTGEQLSQASDEAVGKAEAAVPIRVVAVLND
jgi:hypothetical protein